MSYFVSALIFGLLWTFQKAEDVNYEDELRKYLKLDKLSPENSNKSLIRPVLEPNHTIDVAMAIQVAHITELDESKELLTMMVWRIMHWTVPTLQWNASKFGNTYFLNLPYNLVWKPDLYMLHEADYTGQKSKPQREEFWAYYTGWVSWVSHISIVSICPLDFQRFPFDEHECVLEFGSYSHSGAELSLTLAAESGNFTSDLTHFLEDENNQWEIVRSWGKRNIYVYYEEYSWHTLEFHIVLRRRNSYFGISLISPMIATMLITLLGFWLPWDSTGRLILGEVNLVILTIFSIHLYWVVPRSGSSVPGVVICCGNSLLFASLSMLLTVICLRISRQTPSMAVPDVFKKYLQGIPAKILGLGDGFADTKDGGLLTSDESPTHRDDESTPPQKDSTNSQAEWIMILTAINRLAFISFLIIYIVILLFTFA